MFASSFQDNNCVQRLIDNKMLYLVCCALHFFGARNPEVHYYFQGDGREGCFQDHRSLYDI